MRTTRSLSIIYPLLALWIAVAGHGVAEAARIAVVGDASLGDLVDVTSAQLSTLPDLSVLERSDLDKLGREQALKEMVSSNDLSSVQFVPADGLLILRAVEQDGKTGVFARLVAVRPGIVLREMALPDGADAMAQAKAITKEFAPCWPKLGAIQKGKITALSLLGLRFEVDAPETREMERQINVLLASRLSTEPDTVVLERWRLNDAVFERSLNAQQPAPFWTGSSLIDGSMTFVGNQVVVKLRLRPPQGTEITITDTDKADQLPSLIGRLADKIQAHPMTKTAWQPAAEADHFAALGKWCLDNHLYDEGAQAIESALSLGDSSRATHMLQIRGCALLAYPDELEDIDSGYGKGLGSIDSVSLQGRLQSGARAADLTCEYLKANQDYSGPSGTMEDPAEFSPSILDNLLRTLRLAYDKDYHRDHADDVAALRQKVQKLIAQMEPLFAAKPADEHDYFLKYKIDYAAFWHESPEATLVYYRELLNDKTNGATNRRDLFLDAFPILRRPYLDADDDLPGAPNWYKGSPWIIAWDDRPPAEIKTLWQTFLKDLEASPNPILQGDELKFESSCTQRRPARGELDARFVAFIQQHRDMISGSQRNDFIAGFFPSVLSAARNPDPTGRNQLRDLVQSQLKSHAVLPAEWISDLDMLFAYRDKSDEAQEFLKLLDDYCQWYQTQLPQDSGVVRELAKTRKAFFDPTAETALKNSLGGFLQVHRHWPSAGEMTGPPGAEIQIDSRTFMTAENKIWFLSMRAPNRPSQVVCIDPANLQTVSTFSVPDEYSRIDYAQSKDGTARQGTSLGVNPQWLALAMNGRALVCSRINNQWRSLDVPPANYKPRWAGQELYWLYDYNPMYRNYMTGAPGAATAVSGLIHAALPSGEIDNVISSRRVPPQTALDGKPLGYAVDLWGSPNLMLAFAGDSPRFQVFSTPSGKNDWKSVFSDSLGCEVSIEPQGALIGRGFDDHGFAQLVLMNGSSSQLLLSNPQRIKSNDSPLWDCPDDIRTAQPGEIAQSSPVMRGNDLCIYYNTLNGIGDGYHAALYYFVHGQKTGVKIPLAFNLEGAAYPGFTRMQSAIYSYQSVQATDYGLVVGQVMHGFWVIPWSDIDAYRAKLTAGVLSAAPVANPGEAANGASSSAGEMSPVTIQGSTGGGAISMPPPAMVIPPTRASPPAVSHVEITPRPLVSPPPSAIPVQKVPVAIPERD